MKTTINRKEILVLSVIIVLAVYFFCISLKYTHIGIYAEQNQNGDWTVTRVLNSVSWASVNQIEPGDNINKINGEDPSQFKKLIKFGKVEMVDSLVIKQQNGIEIVYKSPSYNQSQIEYVIIPMLVFFLLLHISIFIYKKQGIKSDTRLLVSFSIMCALTYATTGATSRYNEVGELVLSFSYPILPVLLLHYLYRYFSIRGEKFIAFWIIKMGYIIILIHAVIVAVYLVSPIFNYKIYTYIIINSYSSIFILYSLFTFVISVYRYLKGNPAYRPVYKIILLGLVTSFFPFIFFVGIPDILFGIYLMPYQFAIMFAIFMPIMYLYLLSANQLIDIDYILKRVRYYWILAVIPTVFIMVIIYLIWDIDSTNIVKCFETYMVIHIALVLFLYIKENLDYRLSALWFKEKHHFQNSMNEFTQQLSKMMNTSELEAAMIKTLKSVLPIGSVILLEKPLNESCVVKEKLGSLPNPSIFAQINNSADHTAVGHFIPVDSGICFLYGNTGNCGRMVWFDNKVNHTRFNRDEVSWIKTLLSYVAIVFENFQLIDDFIGNLEQNMSQDKNRPAWLLRLLFSISENERRRLSSDLHDTVLQDQIVLYRQLEQLLKESNIPRHVQDQMQLIHDGLIDVIGKIREACNELRPPFLKELGIVEAINKLLSQLKLRNSVEFYAADFQAELDDDQVITIYRIVQELLQNANKHAQASQINLMLSNTEDAIYFTYTDNGIGMDLKKLEYSLTHMGLWGIQERVASLEGTIHFHSTPGEGFLVEISIPLQNSVGIHQ
ncbi:ATP-binding protein [Chengkuizengella axinellae]|uniref:histidine kinase n=1 Tax=Chengkuizengella axinellae TaxID=3064388 RepID=A0ABT9J0D1_9BACL|nr:ATP-binding protein [Chengkuizengella sp. 2205SS18-9]MDP5275037.1 ATP-binding protein [Chengkuizengella sp. 2205SS18-9]